MRSPLPRAVLTRLETGRIVILSIVLGSLVGATSLLLRLLLDGLLPIGQRLTGYSPPGMLGEGGLLMAFGEVLPYSFVWLPALGVIYTALIPTSLGTPYAQLIKEAHASDRNSNKGTSVLDSVRVLGAVILTHTGGLLVGRDSAFVMVGQLTTRLCRVWIRLDPTEVHILGLAGAAAGLGTVLHAPLVAAVLIAEVLYRRFEFEFEVLMPCILAAVAAYTIYGLGLGFGPLLNVPAVQVPAIAQGFGYVGVALVVSVLSWLLLLASRVIPTSWHEGSKRLLLGGLFGLLTAGIAQRLPTILGDGLGWMGVGLEGFLGQEAAEAGLWRWALIAIGARLGFGGGVFPSLAAGGLLGVGLGSTWGLDPTLAGLIGGAAFLTVTLNTPVAAALLAYTWGGDAALPMALLAVGVAHLISGEGGLIAEQLRSRASRTRRALPDGMRAWRIPSQAEPSTTTTNTDSLPETPEIIPKSSLERQLYRHTVPVSWQGTRLKLLTLPPAVEVVGVLRGGTVQLPHPDLRLTAEDELIFLASTEAYAALRTLLRLSGA